MTNIAGGFGVGAIIGLILGGIASWIYLVFALYASVLTFLSLYSVTGLLATVLYVAFAIVILSMVAGLIGVVCGIVTGVIGAIIGIFL